MNMVVFLLWPLRISYHATILKTSRMSNSFLYYVSSIKEKYTGTETIETILLDDFNLPWINWETLSGSNLYENRFLYLPNDIDLFQMINEPTYIEGNTLDLIATSCPDITYSLLCKNLLCKIIILQQFIYLRTQMIMM